MDSFEGLSQDIFHDDDFSMLFAPETELVLNDEFDFNKKDFFNQMLRLIIEQQQPSLIKSIIELGADPNCIYEDDFTPVSLCAAHYNLDCFEMLRAHGANLAECTNMHFAVYLQNIPMINKLMEVVPDYFNILDVKEPRARKTANPFLLAIFYEADKVINDIFNHYSQESIKKLLSTVCPLHYAVYYRKYYSVEALLRNRYVSPNQLNKNGDTPLMMMARIPNYLNTLSFENDLIKITHLLIARGANINLLSKDNQTAYQIAIENEKYAFAKNLDQIKDSNLQFRVMEDKASINSKQANTNKAKIIILDSNSIEKPKQCQSKIVESLDGQAFLDQALRLAIEREQLYLIKGMLDLGANAHCVYEDKFTPLSLCARHKNLDCFELLYSQGVPIDKKNPFLLAALYGAIALENIPLLQRIMKQDFKKVNELCSRLTKSTPLHYAVFHGHYNSLEALLQFMHPDQKDKHGDTPLVFLAKHSESIDNIEGQMCLAELAQLLLDNKANFYARSAEGFYPLEIAQEKKKTILVDKLMEFSTGIKSASLQFSPAFKPVSKPNESNALIVKPKIVIKMALLNK